MLRTQLSTMRPCLFILLLVAVLSYHVDAQVQFTTESYAELLEGQELDRPIFIDVYTAWCGPCKQMDKTTFQDESVGKLLNDNFICIKWDAEDIKYRADARRLGVNAYPTYLFLDSTGQLISSPSGYRDSKNFMNLTQSVLDFIHDNPLEGVNISHLRLEEGRELLVQIADFDTDHKTMIVDHMISQLTDRSDSLWTAYADVIAINSYEDMDIEVVQQLIDAQEPIRPNNFTAIRNNRDIYRALTDVLHYKYDLAIDSGNYSFFRRISKMKTELSSWFNSNKTTESEIAKQLQTDRLNYYKHNRIADHYKPLADSMIAEYILPHSPEFIKKIDYEDAKRTDAWRTTFSDEETEVVDSTTLSYFKDHNYNGIKIADRLDEIANNIINIYDDTESHKDALNYAILAYEYAPLPKYLVTKAQIEYQLGDKDSAIVTLKKGRAHQFFKSEQARINTMLYKFGIEE